MLVSAHRTCYMRFLHKEECDSAREQYTAQYEETITVREQKCFAKPSSDGVPAQFRRTGYRGTGNLHKPTYDGPPDYRKRPGHRDECCVAQ